MARPRSRCTSATPGTRERSGSSGTAPAMTTRTTARTRCPIRTTCPSTRAACASSSSRSSASRASCASATSGSCAAAVARHNDRMTTVAAPGALDSFSPLTGERIGSVPTVRPEDVQAVVDDVGSVQPFWAQLPLAGRARYMKRGGQAILGQIDGLARLLGREEGKAINEGFIMELLPAGDALGLVGGGG